MYWSEFLTIALAHLLAVASPGPDFIVVTLQSMTAGTRSALWTSLGVGSAILLHVSYCVLGVAIVLAQSPQLFRITKFLAAAYLVYLGVQALRNARFSASSVTQTEPVRPAVSAKRAFALGFLTNGLNPKATLFFLALFTAVIDDSTPTTIQVAYGVYMAVATFVWFAALSLLLTTARVRDSLMRAGVWLEGGMGVVLIVLAIQIVATG